MKQEIEKKIKDWTYVQSLPFDILQSLTNEQLLLTVGKNMGTLGEQFRHMARVRMQYAEAIETGKIDKMSGILDLEIAKNKDKLVEFWQKANQKLISILQNTNAEKLENLKIDWKLWGIDELDIHTHLNILMDHETLHSGQLVVYLKTLEIHFPKSWEAWAL